MLEGICLAFLIIEHCRFTYSTTIYSVRFGLFKFFAETIILFLTTYSLIEIDLKKKKKTNWNVKESENKRKEERSKILFGKRETKKKNLRNKKVKIN